MEDSWTWVAKAPVPSVGIGSLPRAALLSVTSTPRPVASPAAASIAVALFGGAALTVAATVLGPAAMEGVAATAVVLGAAAGWLSSATGNAGPTDKEGRAARVGHGKALPV
ncbi:unnamed protein product [Cuscuta campestris]|uniref:Uncharacterized protein n=1 Tax=Cuscuta campestris TaxID=132261 RepID=A0A484KX85_9ASTE|nr:unnamed protein product [Cuscuta campestris]